MNTADDLRYLDATAQAALVRDGEVTPAELVDAAIARIERLDPALNAVIMPLTSSGARAAAARRRTCPTDRCAASRSCSRTSAPTSRACRPTCGNRAAARRSTTAPCRHRAGRPLPRRRARHARQDQPARAGPQPDHPAARLRADPQPVGPEPLARRLQRRRRPPRSPPAWCRSRTPTTAAARSACPAAWCGLVGLKPSRGPHAVPRRAIEPPTRRAGRQPLGARHRRRARRHARGRLPPTSTSSPPPLRPYVDELGRDAGPAPRRRCSPTAPATRSTPPAWPRPRSTGRAARRHGPPRRAGRRLGAVRRRRSGERLVVDGGDRPPRRLARRAGRPAAHGRRRSSPTTGRRPSGTAPCRRRAWIADQERQQAWAGGVLDWFAASTCCCRPTAGCPPLPTDQLWPADDRPWKIGETYGRIGRFTLPFNATGQPAISLPLHWTADGLPVGVQLVAGIGREDLLLRRRPPGGGPPVGRPPAGAFRLTALPPARIGSWTA